MQANVSMACLLPSSLSVVTLVASKAACTAPQPSAGQSLRQILNQPAALAPSASAQYPLNLPPIIPGWVLHQDGTGLGHEDKQDPEQLEELVEDLERGIEQEEFPGHLGKRAAQQVLLNVWIGLHCIDASFTSVAHQRDLQG